MANNTSKATFPMTLHGVIVNNHAEARKVCLKHHAAINAAYAEKQAIYVEEQILSMMPQGFTRSEAKHIATGGTMCSSVSAFV
jgi:hypothetical protein